MKRIASALLALTALCEQPSSVARELSEYTLKQKIEASDFIFVGYVSAIEKPEQEIDGVREFAVVTVTESIKGAEQGKELKFVVHGSIAEASPACCLAGREYLFFARDGVQVLLLDENSIGGRIDLQGAFISASNGSFSTYLINSGLVSGWPSNDIEVARPLAAVRQEICETARALDE